MRSTNPKPTKTDKTKAALALARYKYHSWPHPKILKAAKPNISAKDPLSH
jgi:hypothetical protein